jgi:nucleotidyltransferase/DNA polymerase involved in DNA repair
MPDGSYYIREGAVGSSDLQNAIKAVGRASGSDGTSDEQQRNAVRRHVMKRAKALGLSEKIPDTWNPDGTTKHFDVDEFLEHFGVKGMHWGVRKDRGGSSHPVSDDAKRAQDLRVTVKAHGTSALSNQDLQHLVSRLNLESQHSRLSPEEISSGKKIMNEILSVGGNVAKQQATTYASKYAAQGVEHLIKNAGNK